ncbi:hypothetical protein BFP72_11215 [Reichenbachiella sp. 5M10]|uniref:hypothetical protein n=1 Tax=Reichenbachiella sp. 5M10 TaxID=1889772 RepID=UPI000C14AC57|nr:hypothetical protein [Reichenbachiella sp. 5M10]PIB35921.1 hypothetical protein BFP72_11215 [Reichenbachiella sp. 5M10]
MKYILFVFVLFVGMDAVTAQTEELWGSENLKIEETTQESGDKVYNLYSKEMKYNDMYYLLTVSSGTMQEVYSDVVYYDDLCKKMKGTREQHKGNDIATRDDRSIFVVVDGDVGFTAMFRHDLLRVKKKLEKRAEELGVTLDDSLEAAVSFANRGTSK